MRGVLVAISLAAATALVGCGGGSGTTGQGDRGPLTAARLQVQIHRTQLSGLTLAHEIGLEVCGTE